MFKTRTKKIWGDVRKRLGRTILVSTAIFIGVFGTISLFSLSDIIVSQLNEDINEDELVMLDVFVQIQSGATPDNAQYLAELEQFTGVTNVFGSAQGFAQFATEADGDLDDGIVTGFTISLADGLPLESMRLLEGEYPVDGQNEVVLEQRTAENYDLEVGDSIYFRILSESRVAETEGEVGTIEEWTVSGIVFHPYVGATAGTSSDPETTIYATEADTNYIGGASGLSAFRFSFVDFATAEATSEDIATYVAEETPYIPAFVFAQDPEQNQLIIQAQTLGGTMTFLAIVALVVSGFLVVNVITSIVVEQRQQIGVMKSIGATRSDNFFMYSGIAFAYGVIGVIPGVLLGVPAGNTFSQLIAPEVNTVLEGFRISFVGIFLGVFMGIAVPVMASIVPVFFGTRVKILDAMTDLGIDVNYGGGVIAKIIGALPIPITIRQGLSNVSLKKSRLLFTVITLAIAAGAFIGIFAVFTSLTDGIGQFLDSFNVEVGVFPTETRDPDELRVILENFSEEYEGANFAAIEPGANIQVEFEGYEPLAGAGGPPGIFAYGYDVNSDTPAFGFEIDEGGPLTEANYETGIIFSSLLATNMEKTVGDTVILKVPGNSVEMTIIGISEFPIDQVWMDWRTVSTVTGFTSGAPRANEYLTEVTVADYAGSLADNQLAVVGFDEQVADFLTFDEGDFVTPGENEVILTAEAANNAGVSVGDTLNFTSTNGDSADFTVAGIFSVPPIPQAEDFPTDVAGVYFQDLVAFENISLDGKPIPAGYFIVTDLDDPTAAELDDILEELDEALLSEGISSINFNFVELTDQISAGFLTIQVILQAVSLLIALVGALGLLTTLSMSVFERQKEIGVMRSIGAGSSTIAIQFLTEGLVVGIIAWVVGLPLSYMIEVALLSVTGFDETFPAVFPIDGAIIGLIGMLVITTVASLWPSLSAANKTVSDILRYQ